MGTAKMHADEVDTDVSLVRELIADQFPEWSTLPIVPFDSTGTDHTIWRLGDDMYMRLPRKQSATGQIDRELEWLPRLAPQLPVPIPISIAKGSPAAGYPFEWSVYPWLPGTAFGAPRIDDAQQFASDLADFVAALQAIDPTDGPGPAARPWRRGVPLATRDEYTRDAIDALVGVIDTDAAVEAWETDMGAAVWDSAPVWLHGDLLAGNLLVEDGRLSAVIDWGGLSVGDPAADVMPAWAVLAADTRETFRRVLAVDDATWARGRAWALSIALLQLPYYKDTNPTMAADARRTIDEVLTEHAAGPQS